MQTTNNKKVANEYAQIMLNQAMIAHESILKQIDTANLLRSTYRAWKNAQDGIVDF